MNLVVGAIYNGRRLLRIVANPRTGHGFHAKLYVVECVLCRRQHSLRRYNVLSKGCGPCRMVGRVNRRADYTGQTIANRTVIEFAYSKCASADRRKVAMWRTECRDCGVIANVRASELRNGVGCGCGPAKRRRYRERRHEHMEV